jgi:hypothetical protein
MSRIHAIALSAWVGLGLGAQQAPDPILREVQAENARIQELWKAKAFAEGWKVLQARAQSPGFEGLEPLVKAGVHYNMACAASLLGRPSEALSHLGVAVGEGFKDWATLSGDTDLDALRKDPGFAWLADIVRRRGDYVGILRRFAAYSAPAPLPAFQFTYQSRDAAELKAFRQAYRLDEVAGPGTEFERLVNLMRWVHRQVRHDGQSKNPEPKNAMHLLEVCKAEGRGINCRMMATILNEAYLSLGFPSRQVTCQPLDEKDPDCHVITTVWSPSLGKWLYMDPTMEAYVMDAQGAPLSIAEVRASLIAGDPLQLAPGANWNGRPEPPAQYLAYMAKNLVRITCPLESAYGYESRGGVLQYLTLDSSAFPARPAKGPGGAVTHDPRAFWAAP